MEKKPDHLDQRIANLDPKRKALMALAVAAQSFLNAALAANEQLRPGAAQATRVLFEEGKNSILISLQFDREKLSAALALAEPTFTDVLSDYEMRLHGSFTSIFGDPEKVKIHDLSKLN